jgi:hypothetical protein
MKVSNLFTAFHLVTPREPSSDSFRPRMITPFGNFVHPRFIGFTISLHPLGTLFLVLIFSKAHLKIEVIVKVGEFDNLPPLPSSPLWLKLLN